MIVLGAYNKQFPLWKWLVGCVQVVKQRSNRNLELKKIWDKCHNSLLLRPIIEIDHSQLQKSKPRTILNLPVMPKIIPKYKWQTPKYLLTCLWYQIPYSKLLYMPLMKKRKNKQKCKCHTQNDFHTCLWCQRPNWCTNTIPENNSQSAYGAKDHTQEQLPDPRISHNLSVMPKPYPGTKIMP